MAGQTATLNITARIGGYQASLQQFRKAIDQLDPGSQLRQSLEKSFKGAEDYITKLAKTPIVNVGNDSQIQRLEQSLSQASLLIHNMAQQFQLLTIGDIKTDVLNNGLTEVLNTLQKLQNEMGSLGNGPQLNQLTNKVETVRAAFSILGKDFQSMSAAEGVAALDEKIASSTNRIEQLRQQANQAKKAIDSWVTVESSGIWGRAAFNDRMKVHKILKQDNQDAGIRNIDFSAQGYDWEAINNVKRQIADRLVQNQPELYQAFGQQIMQAIESSFTTYVNADNLNNTINNFVRQVSTIIGAKASEVNAVSQLLFGRENGATANQATEYIRTILQQLSINAQQSVQPLRQAIELMAKHQSLLQGQQQHASGLIDVGRLAEAKKYLEEIYDSEHEYVKHANDPKKQAQAQLAAVNAQIRQEQDSVKTLTEGKIAIQEDPAVLKMKQDYEALRQEVQQLRAELEQMRGQKLDNLQQLASDGDKAAQSVKLTAQELSNLQKQADAVKAQQEMVGKVQGVLQRWFSVYAVINMISRAVRSMISTVQELDKTITNIAIVTNMSQNDLWQQMPTYTKTAREFAASISGVYEVSQLYYQQGELNI